jgi:SARP family transcriptional regulator, regulator of embCAB operon
MATSRRVLVADGDAVVRAALRLLLARNPYLRVVAEAENLEELRRDSTCGQADIVLLDMDLRGLLPDELERMCHASSTVALSTREEHRQAALDAGAAAFVCKSESPQQLLAVLQAVAAIAQPSASA